MFFWICLDMFRPRDMILDMFRPRACGPFIKTFKLSCHMVFTSSGLWGDFGTSRNATSGSSLVVETFSPEKMVEKLISYSKFDEKNFDKFTVVFIGKVSQRKGLKGKL